MPAKSSKGAKPTSCAKCGGAMETGFVPGPALYLVMPLLAVEWAPGRPQTPAKFGTKGPSRRNRVITAWRCKDCGFLESYAN